MLKTNSKVYPRYKSKIDHIHSYKALKVINVK